MSLYIYLDIGRSIACFFRELHETAHFVVLFSYPKLGIMKYFPKEEFDWTKIGVLR